MTGQPVKALPPRPAPALLAALEAAGVAVQVEGGGLTLTGRGRPPAELLEAVRASKPELLAYLTAKEARGGLPSPDAPPAVCSPVLGSGQAVPAPPRLSAAPDWAALFAQPGHCGSCARWEAAPDWGPLMGTCDCPPSAFGVGGAFLAIHGGHRCLAWGGQGYRTRGAA